MDADERLTPALKAEIAAIVNLNPAEAYDCYWIGFIHFFMGKRVHYSGWQNDKTIRLIRRDKCRYNKNRVHEEIVTTNLRVGKLENRFLHYTFKDFTHFMDKQVRYARWSAEDKFDNTPKVTAYHLLIKPFARFFKHFVLKMGFLDGRVGFLISVIASYCVFLRYVFIMEKRRNDSRLSERLVWVKSEKHAPNVAEKEVS